MTSIRGVIEKQEVKTQAHSNVQINGTLSSGELSKSLANKMEDVFCQRFNFFNESTTEIQRSSCSLVVEHKASPCLLLLLGGC